MRAGVSTLCGYAASRLSAGARVRSA
ncbi:MAG: hypothetical protein ACD_54C00294G0005, partial [uncultured bacterium]